MDNQFANDALRLNNLASFSLSPQPPQYDANNPPWGLGGALLVWLSSLLLLAFVPLVFLIPYSLHRGLSFADPDFVRRFAEFAITDKNAIIVQVVSLLPIHLLTFGLVWALVTRLGKFPFLRMIGWEWPQWFWPWLSVGLGVALFVGALVIAKLVGAEKPTQLEQIINSSMAARLAIAFLAVFTAPFVEEFIYRGVLFAALQRLTGAVLASLITLGLFILIHVPQYWPNVGVIAAVGFLSVALTVVRATTGRLLPCVVIHFVFNGIQSGWLLVEPYISSPVPVPDPAPALLLPLLLSIF